MAERALHGDLKKRLVNNEPFIYAHLIKYERPYAYQTKRSLNNTDAKRYAYLTDGAMNISFDDSSVDSSGSSNGSQTYIADKILAIGSYSETSEAKATGLTLTLSAESLYSSITSTTITMTATTITVPSTDLVSAGFREGDKISISGGTNSGHEVRITGIKTSNTVLNVSNIDDTLATQTTGTSITLKVISDELKGPLTEMDNDTIKSYHNRDVFIYKAFLDPDDYTVINTPILVYKGIIGSASIKDDPSKNLKVQWKLTSHWGDFVAVNGRLTNDAVHRALNNAGKPQHEVALKEAYADDLGFLHSETTVNVLATYTAIETKQTLKKKSSWFGLKKSYKLVTEEVEVQRDVDLNWALSAQYIPVVYGVDRVAGKPIFVDTKSNDTNNIFIAYSLCEGEIGGIYDVYIDDSPLICLNLADSDARKTGGENADEVEVVCRGRADKGETLGGAKISGSGITGSDVEDLDWPDSYWGGTFGFGSMMKNTVDALVRKINRQRKFSRGVVLTSNTVATATGTHAGASASTSVVLSDSDQYIVSGMLITGQGIVGQVKVSTWTNGTKTLVMDSAQSLAAGVVLTFHREDVDSDGQGVVDGETISLTKPNNMTITLHSGTTNQTADAALVSIAKSPGFKRQQDYYTGQEEYWGPNHSLCDTAYVICAYGPCCME